jgi:ABC-type lipoprotein release transport system permease subunit
MFFTYLRRELRRRRRAALVIALGLALGIGLVITVSSLSSGMKKAQSQVLHSLYGLGTDITVTKAAAVDNGTGGPADGQHFGFSQSGTGNKSQSQDRLRTTGGTGTLTSAQLAAIAKQPGVSAAVGGLTLTDIKVSGNFQFRGGSSSSGSSRSAGSAGGSSGYRGFGGGGYGGAAGGSTPPSGSAGFDFNTFTVSGVDVSDLSVGPLSSLKVTSGSSFTSGDADSLVAVVDSAYAQTKSVELGSTLTIGGSSFKVIGIATADSGSSASDVYIPLTQAQTLSGNAGAVSDVYVKAASSQRIDSIKSAIQKNVSGTTVTTSADMASEVSGSLSTAADLAGNLGRWLSILVLVAAFLVAGLLTSAAVNRRVREFGTLKALGWPSRRVIGQVVGEAVVNGLIGGVLGIALGLAGAYAITAFSPSLSATLGSAASGNGGPGGFGGGGGFGRRFGAAAQSVTVHLTAPVTLSAIALAVLLAVAGGLLAGGFGGWRASRLRPADALRRVE